MRYTTSEIAQHRIFGLATCLLGCTLMIIGSFHDLPIWNWHHIPIDDQTKVLVRIVIGFSLWLFGTLIAMWPEIRKKA